MTEPVFMRTKPAADYLKTTYGEGTQLQLNKLRHTGGGPRFRKLGSRTCVYEKRALDEWAQSRLGPEQASTSDKPAKKIVTSPEMVPA